MSDPEILDSDRTGDDLLARIEELAGNLSNSNGNGWRYLLSAASKEICSLRLDPTGAIVHDNDELLAAAEAAVSGIDWSPYFPIFSNEDKAMARLRNAVADMRAARAAAEATEEENEWANCECCGRAIREPDLILTPEPNHQHLCEECYKSNWTCSGCGNENYHKPHCPELAKAKATPAAPSSPCQLCGDVYPHRYLFDLKDGVDAAGRPTPGPKMTCLKCWGRIEEREAIAAMFGGFRTEHAGVVSYWGEAFAAAIRARGQRAADTTADDAQAKAEMFMKQLNAARNVGADTTPFVYMLARLIREGR